MMNKKKWIKFLVYGMIGAVLTMIGDCLLLGVDTREAVGSLGQYIVSAQIKAGQSYSPPLARYNQ